MGNIFGTTLPFICVNRYNPHAGRELGDAIREHDLDRIRAIIRTNPALLAETSLPDIDGATSALGEAVKQNDPIVLKYLLDQGAPANMMLPTVRRETSSQDKETLPPPSTWIETVCVLQQKDIFLILLERTLPTTALLLRCCLTGDDEMVFSCLDRGMNSGIWSTKASPLAWQYNTSPLIECIKSSIQPVEKVLGLVKRKADVNDRPAYLAHQPTPLMTACAIGHAVICEMLLWHGADPNTVVVDAGLPTALFVAVYWGQVDIVKLMLAGRRDVNGQRLGVDMSITKYTGETILEVAKRSLEFARAPKPKHIAKLPLPKKPVENFEGIYDLLLHYH
eukprot:GEMP01076428.1.p1 GENE.GEMP01076428.1~~GEMP01076428.1.p1  ORF type:complete len:345 (+),score=52.23 GEMP01076428.1:30-1037(+)